VPDQDAYACFNNPANNGLFLVNFHISPYKNASFANHEPKGQGNSFNSKTGSKIKDCG
jgi:tmRNA-binding protein